MSDLPLDLAPDLATRLAAALDIEGKIARGLEALAPTAGRDVVVVDAPGAKATVELARSTARVVHVQLATPFAIDRPDASADVVISLWSAFRGVSAAELAEVDRVLRPDGRLLVVHDYGRDDVSRLFGERPEYGAWSQRGGPFLTGGFRVRVLHCFWTFESLEATRAFLGDAFGEAGIALGETLKRPRLSYNVAIYHRWRGGTAPAEAPATDDETTPQPRAAVAHGRTGC